MYKFFTDLSRFFLIFSALGVIFVMSGCTKPNSVTFQDGLIVEAIIGDITYSLEVSESNYARTKGLSSRSELAADSGMLFVFDSSDYHSFWMKDTLIPLKIIWLDENFTVVDYSEMAVEEDPVHPTSSYSPRSPARYAIEINLINDIDSIGIGDKIEISY